MEKLLEDEVVDKWFLQLHEMDLHITPHSVLKLLSAIPVASPPMSSSWMQSSGQSGASGNTGGSARGANSSAEPSWAGNGGSTGQTREIAPIPAESRSLQSTAFRTILAQQRQRPGRLPAALASLPPPLPPQDDSRSSLLYVSKYAFSTSSH